MDSFYAFTYFWLGLVVLIGLVHLVWAIRDTRAGVAEFKYFGPYFRSDEPFGFWALVGVKLATALLLAPFLFVSGLRMLHP